MTGYAISIDDIHAAAVRITPFGLATPLLAAPALSARTGKRILIKAEHRQPTGSFKVRGALNAILSNAELASARGVVTFSTGNHGRALAWAGARVGARCTVYVSTLTPALKRQALLDAGADLRVAGNSQDEAEVLAHEHARRTGALLISPSQHGGVIAGQGTAMLEILGQCPDVGTVIIPVSAGGLAAGMALAAKTLAPHVRVVGVTMEYGAAMHASLEAGRPVAVPEHRSLADSLGGGIGGIDSPTFPIVRDCMDTLLLVSEAAIAGAMVAALHTEDCLLEGAGATPIALLLDPRAAGLAGPIVLLASGGNIDRADVDRLAADNPVETKPHG